ncbi:MAG: DUF354 domain-containing protein [Candidatus Cloacimonetes bacterium]|jgi:predicted glycosyltransferase|nr:DUF354 domain-containing protein [Candidatus Cloacimonadota bacterium]
MNILIDIGHPAHVHYFKNMAWQLLELGHQVLFTVKDKEVAVPLLQAYKFRYEVLGRNKKGIISKLAGLFFYTVRLFKTTVRNRPHILFNASLSAALVSWLLRKYHISLEDTFNMEQVNLYLPFTNLVITGDYPHRNLGRKQLALPFYQELLYLHPKYFTPDSLIYDTLGLTEGDRYAVVRFVSWGASHDVGQRGMTTENKIELVKQLSKYLRVFISSEGELPDSLKEYLIKIPPEKMHDALAFAHLFVGESATMASECTILGTPALYMNSKEFGSTSDQSQYGLLELFNESEADQNAMIRRAVEIAAEPSYKKKHEVKREKLLADKIDVTAFMVWFVENYPNSKKEIQNPQFDFNRFGDN